MKLSIYELSGWYYLVSLDDGPVFKLGYFDGDDYIAEKNISNVENLTID